MLQLQEALPDLNAQIALSLRLSGACIAGKLQQNTHAHNAILKGQTKMAQVVVTLKIMPESPEIDLGIIEKKAKAKIFDFSKSQEIKTGQEPIAFGLKALKIIFVMDEGKGSTDALEEQIKTISGVNSVEVVDVRRAIG